MSTLSLTPVLVAAVQADTFLRRLVGSATATAVTIRRRAAYAASTEKVSNEAGPLILVAVIAIAAAVALIAVIGTAAGRAPRAARPGSHRARTRQRSPGRSGRDRCHRGRSCDQPRPADR